MKQGKLLRTRTVATKVWLPIVILAGWGAATAQGGSLYFPSLGRIGSTFADQWLSARVGSDLLPSLRNLVVGFLLAAVLGIAGGLLLGSVRWLARTAEPMVHFVRSLPPPALLPIALIVLGTGVSMKIAIIAIGSMWPTLLNTMDGVRAVDPQVRAVEAVYGLNRRERLFKVTLPSAGPQIAAGLRTTLQISIILIVVSEMFASTGGIGYQVLLSQQTFAIPETWAGTILLGLVGFVANLIFVRIEKRILSWHTGMHRSREA